MEEKKAVSHECTLAFLLRTACICLKTRTARISRFLIGRSSRLRRRWLYMITMKSNLAVCSCALKRHKSNWWPYLLLLQLTCCGVNRYNLQEIQSGGERRVS